MKYIFLSCTFTLLASCSFLNKTPKYNFNQVKSIIMEKDCSIYSEGGISLFKCNNDIKNFNDIFLQDSIADKIHVKNFNFLGFLCAVSFNGSVQYGKKMYCSQRQIDIYTKFMMDTEPEEYQKIITIHLAIERMLEEKIRKDIQIQKNIESAKKIFTSKLIYEYNEVFNENVEDVSQINVSLNNNLGESLLQFYTQKETGGNVEILDNGDNVVYSLSNASVKEVGDNFAILFLQDQLAKPYERFPLQKLFIENPKPFKLSPNKDLKYREHYIVYTGQKVYKSLFGPFEMPKFKIITDKIYLLESIETQNKGSQ